MIWYRRNFRIPRVRHEVLNREQQWKPIETHIFIEASCERLKMITKKRNRRLRLNDRYNYLNVNPKMCDNCDSNNCLTNWSRDFLHERVAFAKRSWKSKTFQIFMLPCQFLCVFFTFEKGVFLNFGLKWVITGTGIAVLEQNMFACTLPWCYGGLTQLGRGVACPNMRSLT